MPLQEPLGLPELRRLQAELSARHSYREAARLPAALLPCDPMNHATMRDRIHRVAADIEQRRAVPRAVEAEVDPPPEIMVLIDGAYIRAAHGYQARHVDLTVGKVEVAGKSPRQFAVAPGGAESPLSSIREALQDQGWRPGGPITVLSDRETALPSLVRAAVREPVTCILDWWHISMRVQHIQQSIRGICALDPRHRAGLEIVEEQVGRLRHLIWNGYHEEAHDELFGMRHPASGVAHLNGDRFRRPVARLVWNCDDLRRYLANNAGSLINYGERCRSKLPISTSRAEGCVDEIANAPMAKKQRMKWSPQDAHRIAVVRAAVLDGRLSRPPASLATAA